MHIILSRKTHWKANIHLFLLSFTHPLIHSAVCGSKPQHYTTVIGLRGLCCMSKVTVETEARCTKLLHRWDIGVQTRRSKWQHGDNKHNIHWRCARVFKGRCWGQCYRCLSIDFNQVSKLQGRWKRCYISSSWLWSSLCSASQVLLLLVVLLVVNLTQCTVAGDFMKHIHMPRHT